MRNNSFKSPSTFMVQGCTSDAGKSVMVAGIGRVLARRNISVAPFKPQNMALNSAVTSDGGEIGRAQALQAQACFLEPHVDFNPVLLKPSSDTGAQVIVHGKVVSNMQATGFHDYKKVAMDAVLESHTRLQAKYDTIVVEGAGSPAEINLRKNDIANMGFAEAVDCPVVIIADIDRGGVFAHLVGTLELLSESEQSRVVGFIINRFRGDIGLLEPGLEWLEKRTQKPVLGVVPYLHDLYLDAEDAISSEQSKTSSNSFVVAVPVLPRISNHTDFDSLRLHPEVDLRFVSIEGGCPNADLIILPGSKNVIADLDALKCHGWHKGLEKHLRYGGKLIGVCGGYQMLGRTISDPHNIESTLSESMAGFSFLNATTVLEPEKQLRQTNARLLLANSKKEKLQGYEIHCGVTKHTHSPLLELENGTFDGAISTDENVAGTYLHGLFDQADACNALLTWAGFESQQAVDTNTVREQQLDRLADTLEECLDDRFWNNFGSTPSASQPQAL